MEDNIEKTRLDKLSDTVVAFFDHRATLIFMTLIIAGCTSWFAFNYGLAYSVTYGILFAVALLSLTFHFSRLIPDIIIKFMEFIGIIGLITLTMLFGVSAFLSSATSTADPQIAALQSNVDSLERQMVGQNTAVAGLIMSDSAKGIIEANNAKGAISTELKVKRGELEALLSTQTKYDVGKMAIFGHIQKVTHFKQETIDLAIMWYIITILVCVEISKGAAIFRDRTTRPDQDQHEDDYEDQDDEEDIIAENVSNIEDFKRSGDQKTVLFDERGPDQGQTAPDQTKTRRTGLDRDIVAKVRNYVVNDTESVSTNGVAKRFGIGKELVLGVYAELVHDGFLVQNPTNKRYERTERCRGVA